MDNIDDIEINGDSKKALDLMENSNNNVFLTGRAGTGKSTLVQHFRNTTKKKVVVIAPTGVAAVNVRGQTIHSFFKFGIDITLNMIRNQNEEGGIYKNIDTIIVDEISMVRADLFDCMDKFMRLNGKQKDQPFGGVQMIVVGDLYQLPPIVTSESEKVFRTYYKSPYFFDSKVFSKTNFFVIELQKIYRQSEPVLIDILNAVRLGKVEEHHMEVINKRHCEDLDESHSSHIHLVTTNGMADQINNGKLAEIDDELHSFDASITGKFQERSCPTNERLFLKKGAQIIMLNNDSEKRWINGDLGTILDIDGWGGDATITVKLEENGKEYQVTLYKWEMIKYFFNKQTRQIDSKVIGTFMQFPLRLAWALTIHKGQGKTYSHVIVDFGRGTFAHGQAYVALSRCKSLEGLVLRVPLQREHIRVDSRVVEFMERCGGQEGVS